MPKRFSVALVAIFASTTSIPAFAQDEDQDFNGPYISAFGGLATHSDGGADRIIFDTTRDAGDDNTVTTAGGADAFSPGFCNGSSTENSQTTVPCTKDKEGLEYGLRLGFDKRFGDFVGGLLIEGSKNDARDGTVAFSTTPAGYSFTRKLDYAISARARLGYVAGGSKLLLYGTGGGSYAKIKHGFTTTNTANSFTENNDGDMVWGWQGGGGAELMLARNVSLGAEYLYNRYDDGDYFVAIGQGTAGAANPFVLAGGVNARPSKDNYDFHSFRATLAFRF